MIAGIAPQRWRLAGGVVLAAMAIPLLVASLLYREWMPAAIAAPLAVVAVRDLYDVWRQRSRG